MTAPVRVAIVGGGITGLSAAYRLQALASEGDRSVEVTLIEAGGRLGGAVGTERTDDGFVIEAGPDSMAAFKEEGLALCRELGLDEEIIQPPSDRTAYVLYDQRFHELPRGAMGFVPTPATMRHFLRSGLFSGRGKLRMGLEPLVPRNATDEDESLGAFVRRRLGTEALERLVEPLFGGIYAADADRLSLQATFPRFAQLEREHGGLIRGAMAQGRPPSSSSGGRRPSPFASLRSGLGTLIERLEARLDRTRIVKGQPVRSLDRDANDRYRLHLDDETIDADRVLLSTPAYVAADLMRALSPQATEGLMEIPYGSSAIVTLAYPESNVAHPLDATGFLVPRTESRAITACTWSSAKWANRAPEGHALVRCFFGRAGAGEGALAQSNDDLTETAMREMRELIGARGEPVLTRVHRWERAMPQYEVGHLDKLARIADALAQFPGLEIAGSGYRGVGLPDCIRQGHEAAERLLGVESPVGQTMAS